MTRRRNCAERAGERRTQPPERGGKLTDSEVGRSLFGSGPGAFCRVDHESGEHVSSFGSSGACKANVPKECPRLFPRSRGGPCLCQSARSAVIVIS